MSSGSKKYFFDIIISVFTLGVSAAVMYSGIANFNENQRNILKNEVVNKFREKKLDTYVRIASSIGEIVANDSLDPKLKAAITTYYSLYYGEGKMFDDSEMHKILMAYALDLRDYERKKLNKRALDLRGLNTNDAFRRFIDKIKQEELGEKN